MLVNTQTKRPTKCQALKINYFYFYKYFCEAVLTCEKMINISGRNLNISNLKMHFLESDM
jgi:hypothetical protein